jgi:hypothetical protein
MPEIKPGDIIGFSGRSLISAGINLGTYGIPWWSISHVGIIGRYNDRLLLFESTELPGGEPCEVCDRTLCGTQAHDLSFIIEQYKGAVWHYPLYRRLYRHESIRLTYFLLETIGREYDYYGAVRAGGFILSTALAMFFPQDTGLLFCSEWAAAAHQAIGVLQTGNISSWSPNFLTRYERWRGILARPRRLR